MEPVDAAGDAGRAALHRVDRPRDISRRRRTTPTAVAAAALEGRTLDALLVEDYGHRCPDRQWHERERSTSIVQILPPPARHHLPHRCRNRRTERLRPERSAELRRSCRNRLRMRWTWFSSSGGTYSVVRQLPSAIGSSESPFRLPDESEIDRFSALSTTAATANRRGEYIVTPPRTGGRRPRKTGQVGVHRVSHRFRRAARRRRGPTPGLPDVNPQTEPRAPREPRDDPRLPHVSQRARRRWPAHGARSPQERGNAEDRPADVAAPQDARIPPPARRGDSPMAAGRLQRVQPPPAERSAATRGQTTR